MYDPKYEHNQDFVRGGGGALKLFEVNSFRLQMPPLNSALSRLVQLECISVGGGSKCKVTSCLGSFCDFLEKITILVQFRLDFVCLEEPSERPKLQRFKSQLKNLIALPLQ